MKIGLKSDFEDYYDHCFTSAWEEADKVFERLTTVGMPRSTMLLYLDSIGLATPLHGRVQELVPVITERSGMPQRIAEELFEVVVYEDEHLHTGKGKRKLSCRDALAQFPEAYASVFIPSHPGKGGTSLRYLRVGMRQFWLRYTSHDDWRSNCGEVSVELLGEEEPAETPHQIPYPLFALDFVKADRLYAVDLNIAPRVGGTGIEGCLSAPEFYQEITAKMRNGKR